MDSLAQADIFAGSKAATTPNEIDKNLQQLPSIILYEDRISLPPTSGIYIVSDVDYSPILYIGQSINLLNRIRSHNMRKTWLKTSECGIVRMIWIEIPDLSLLNSVEQALIEYFDPPLNTRGRLCRYQMVRRNDCVQKASADWRNDNSEVSKLYCNGCRITYLHTNELSEIQIKRILNSYVNIDWEAL